MTVKQLTQIERYVGPSTATKPLDCSIGSTFLEEDTSRLFVFDGTGWFPKTQDIVIYDAEGNPLEIEGGRMKVSVDASVVAPEEVVWSNITLRDGQNPSNKLAVLPDGSLKVQQSGTIVLLEKVRNFTVTPGSTIAFYTGVNLVSLGISQILVSGAMSSGAQSATLRISYRRDDAGGAQTILTPPKDIDSEGSYLTTGGWLDIEGEIAYFRLRNNDLVDRTYALDLLGRRG